MNLLDDRGRALVDLSFRGGLDGRSSLEIMIKIRGSAVYYQTADPDLYVRVTVDFTLARSLSGNFAEKRSPVLRLFWHLTNCPLENCRKHAFLFSHPSVPGGSRQ